MITITVDVTIMPIRRDGHSAARSGRRRGIDRAVELYQPTGGGKPGKVSSGTGYLLDDGLVLTAAHVVQQGRVAFVRLASGPTLFECEVVWRRYDAPAGTGIDAALLRITDAAFVPPKQPAVRWGRLVTTAACPVEAIGFPATMGLWRDARLRYRDAAHVRGEILPGSRVKAGRYEIRVWTPVPPVGRPKKRRRKSGTEQVSRWSGMSGAGVCTGGLLVGLVVKDPDPTGAALTAVLTDSLLADPDFAHVVGAVQPVPVELDDVLERYSMVARSPTGLLRAEIATVRFHGRDAIVAELLDWCSASDDFAARLVTAPAGEGKTRLAHEMVQQLQRAGWCAGFLDAACTNERLHVLTELTEPLFLVVDYAETRGAQLRMLVQMMERGGNRGRLASSVRLLLLARSTGEWWDGLRSATRILRGLPPRSVLALPELQPSGSSRVAAFRDALADLHAGLSALPDYRAAVPFDPSQVAPPPLGHPRFGRPLTVQMAALAGLLQHLSPVDMVSEEPEEEILLRHEARFWSETAPVHGLTHLHPHTLRQLVAVATLCPVIGSEGATELLGHLTLLRDETANTQIAVAAWLHELYAASGDYWHPLVPDALGEYLVGRTVKQFPNLLDDLAGQVDHLQAEQMLTVLCGASGRFPALADSIVRYVVGRPRPLAFAAINVNVRGGYAVLTEALDRLIAGPAADTVLLKDLLSATPDKTILLAGWAVRLATRLVELRCAESPDGLVALAAARQYLAFRLAEVGRHDDALGHAVEAVRLHREAVELGLAEPDGLAESLLAYGSRLAVLGRLDDAVRAAEEAVSLCQVLDRERGEQLDRARLATALHHQALWLHDVGRYADAERVGAYAIQFRTDLADLCELYRAQLASSSLNYACYLQDAGRPADGLRYARAAVETYRSLAEESPDAYLVGLGRALVNLARLLAALDDALQALICAEEAVRIYRLFVREDTVNPLAELTIALANYGRRLAACERTSEAITAFEEAEGLCRRLAAERCPGVAERLATVQADLAVLRRPAGVYPGRE